jgi:membrane protease YdiL (CAAX protease family)
MTAVRTLAVVFVSMVLTSPRADAQLLPLPERSDVAARMDALNDELREAFESALAVYDNEIRDRPFDVARRIDRCRFIDEFSYSNEYLPWLDEIYELGEQCIAAIESEFPNHPEAVLYRLEFLYGEELLAATTRFDGPASPPGWTRGQTARLYSMRASAADSVGNGLAGRFAQHALELDASADVRLIAAQSLIDAGDLAAAADLLQSPFDDADPDVDPYYFVNKIRLLALAGDRQGVAGLYARLKEGAGYYDSSAVAAALRDAGFVELARVEFQDAAANPGYLVNGALDLFRFELEFGSASQAHDAYEAMRDVGWAADPLAVNRVALFLEHPTLPWRSRDLLGLAGFLAALSAVAIVALIPVSFVHYRGLALRLRKGSPAAVGGLRLRHAWYGMFALGVASLAMVYGLGPGDLFGAGDATWPSDIDSGLVARSVLLEFLVELLLLAPLVWLFVRRESAPATQWSVQRAIVLAILVALVFRIPLLIYWFANPDIPQGLVEETYIWDVLRQVADEFGVLAAFWLMSVVAPIAEEFLFRGVLLNVFARHVSFWAANIIQAGLFAAMHLEPAAFPMLFLLGITAGFFARRSGGLLAPIVLHAIFNLLAGLYFLI